MTERNATLTQALSTRRAVKKWISRKTSLLVFIKLNDRLRTKFKYLIRQTNVILRFKFWCYKWSWIFNAKRILKLTNKIHLNLREIKRMFRIFEKYFDYWKKKVPNFNWLIQTSYRSFNRTKSISKIQSCSSKANLHESVYTTISRNTRWYTSGNAIVCLKFAFQIAIEIMQINSANED